MARKPQVQLILGISSEHGIHDGQETQHYTVISAVWM